MNRKTRLSTLSLLAAAIVAVGLLHASAFTPVNGTYNGLFFETNSSWQQSSGILTVTSTSRGTYSVRLQLGPARYSFSGRFAPDGSISRDILRRGDTTLNVQLQVDATDPDLITGSVGDGTWTATLYADRAVFNGRTSISPDLGQYTMVLIGDFTSTNTPGGESFGTATVDKAGRIRLSASLADGTKLTQSATVSKAGQWPLYSPLYRGWGSLYGWVQLNGSTNEDLSGDVTWIRPQMPWTWYYPDGFAVIASAWGSRYVRPPSGTKVLELSNAQIQFNGGNLSQNFTNPFTLDSNNRILNQGSGLRLSFSLSNGSFSGRVLDPTTFDWISFKGVVLQNDGVAAGFFPGWDQTGEVWIEGL